MLAAHFQVGDRLGQVVCQFLQQLDLLRFKRIGPPGIYIQHPQHLLCLAQRQRQGRAIAARFGGCGPGGFSRLPGNIANRHRAPGFQRLAGRRARADGALGGQDEIFQVTIGMTGLNHLAAAIQ